MIPATESATVEFKAKHTNTYLKTVCAFANYGTGSIFFGINDEGDIVGVTNVAALTARIENQLNTAIEPRPNYDFSFPKDNVIQLIVYEGLDKPYQYQGKTYRRGGTSTVVVDRAELQHLFLQGAQRSFDELRSHDQNLTFRTLATAFTAATTITEFNSDTLKTLGLLTSEGYNQAAALLSDTNTTPGIDIVRYGSNENEFADRITLSGVSIVDQYQRALDYFTQFYSYEKITGFTRQTYDRIPKVSFRESLANALAHRDWSQPAAIQIAMFADRIEITSPGGLPRGVTRTDYLDREFSQPRNPLIANVFHRLGYMEKWGTGIKRIRSSYANAAQAPNFDLTPTMIRVVLPVITEINPRHQTILNALGTDRLSRADLEKRTGLTKTILLRAITELEKQGMLLREGAGPATKYRRP